MNVPFTRLDEIRDVSPFPFALSEAEGAQRPTPTSKCGATCARWHRGRRSSTSASLLRRSASLWTKGTHGSAALALSFRSSESEGAATITSKCGAAAPQDSTALATHPSTRTPTRRRAWALQVGVPAGGGAAAAHTRGARAERSRRWCCMWAPPRRCGPGGGRRRGARRSSRALARGAAGGRAPARRPAAAAGAGA